jgi:lipopolysaccharide transport system permease protein
MATKVSSPNITVIQPEKGWVPIRLRELWDYRELVYFFVWRDVKVRYKQTIIGVAWAVIQPFFMALLFSVVFTQLAGLSTGGAPPFLFYYVALLPWNLFAKGLTEGSTSLSANQRLITRVYFPRLVLPISTVVSGLVDFAIGLGVLVGLLAYFGVWPTIAVVSLPLFSLIAILSAMGIAFWLSAVDARYRDVRYALPFVTQVWFFGTVLVPLNKIPESWRWLYSLNPMAGVVDGFRWAFLGQEWTLDPAAWVSVLIVLGIFVGGLFYFRRAERTFADLV